MGQKADGCLWSGAPPPFVGSESWPLDVSLWWTCDLQGVATSLTVTTEDENQLTLTWKEEASKDNEHISALEYHQYQYQ